MLITGIGSRETPAVVLSELTKIGKWCLENGHIVRSGHADGADYAFEAGALLNTEVYLPWKTFNNRLLMLGKPIIVPDDQKYDAMVRKYHPNPSALSRGAFALMGRNSCQVLGLDLNTPSNAVVCWAKSTGGTQQALRIAKDYKIPIFNLIEERYDTADKVIVELKKIGASDAT